MKRALLLIAPLLAALALPGPGTADGKHDHDDARAARRRGEVLPLSRVLEIAETEIGGRVIEVDFEHERGRYLYELELVTEAGLLVEVEIDAATGTILDRDAEHGDDHETDSGDD